MLGPWQVLDPSFRYFGSNMLEFGGYLYQFQGRSTSGAALATDCFVMSSKILEDGTLAPAKDVSSTLEARTSTWLIKHGEYVFLIGGTATGNQVTRFHLEANGGCSAPFTCPPLPFATLNSRIYTTALMVGDIVYFYDFQASVAGLSVYAARVTSDGLQNITLIGGSPTVAVGWNTATALIYKNNLILVGGASLSGNLLVRTIWACKVNGLSMGPWRAVGIMPSTSPTMTFSPMATVIDDKIIVGGGGATTPQNKVFAASIDKDANIGVFTEINTLPVPVSGAGIVTTAKGVYICCGLAAATDRRRTIQFAKILRGG